ncbi:hypothetical protein D6C13_17165 [Rahnella woolbedingensis]|uniref:Uncharacterized protein n=1 Tax=Rahnella woolbedingensis TaxID=1510574 RepID=A0A419N5Y2_9GAMM|nr:hypothetical protein D6C13_17165 [Rahnella woolbedingensis]
MVYILDEIVTMIMDFLIYQQYQRNLLPPKVGLLRFVVDDFGTSSALHPPPAAHKLFVLVLEVR